MFTAILKVCVRSVRLHGDVWSSVPSLVPQAEAARSPSSSLIRLYIHYLRMEKLYTPLMTGDGDRRGSVMGMELLPRKDEGQLQLCQMREHAAEFFGHLEPVVALTACL